MEDKKLIELIKVSIDKGKDSETQNDNTIFYYDRYSRKIFDVDENGIRVYNRKAKNLKKNFLINMPKDSLISIAVDKELKYLLCFLLNNKGNKNNNEIKKKLLLVNTTKGKLLEIEDNFNYLLGMFFIGKFLNVMNYDINNVSNNANDFCLVHCDRVVFYGIEKKSNGEEYIKKLSTVTANGNALIKDFSFDFKHKILFYIKTNLSVSFIILTNRKTYKTKIKPKIPYITTLKEKSNFMGTFRKVGDDQKKLIKDNYDNLDKYTQTQFFLETIYNELYLICLCYENHTIYLHKLENLNNLDEYKEIPYGKHSHFSALQVIDNLIIVHNFITKIIVVIDIKSKIKIIREFYFNFPYQNNLHINGEILEERKFFSNNKLINVNGGTLYNVKFNEKVYDELEEIDLKEKRKKKKELKKKNKDDKDECTKIKAIEMNRYDILKNILNRKGTSNLILSILYKIILNNDEKSFLIIKFFKEIISLENTAKEKIEVISDKKLAKKELSESNLPYEVPKPFNVIGAKKVYIQQMDIIRNLFSRFDSEKNQISTSNDNSKEKDKIEEKSIDDELILRVLFYMIQFYNEINNRKIDLKPGFYSIMLKYMKELKQKEKLLLFFIHEVIPLNDEIGKYLIELSLDKNIKNRELFSDLGFKILKRTNNYEYLLVCLLKTGDIPRAMYFLNEYSSKFTYQQLSSIFLKNKEIIENNKDLFLNYIN